LISQIDNLLAQATQGCSQKRIASRFRNLVFGLLTCLGRKTITGALTASGQQFKDWSAGYRLFSDNRVDMEQLFKTSQKEVLNQIGPDQMIVAHMDDTIIKKTGKKVPGTGWRRDPLGPPFQSNFIWGQRFIQLSMALPGNQGPCQSRAIPVDFCHSPSAKRPGKGATQEQIKQYREEQRQLNLSLQGVECISKLRQNLDQHGARQRELCVCVDGSYTNSNVFKNLPGRVTLMGRIRKDCRLHKSQVVNKHTGRKKVYGEQIPTPEQVRQSDDYPWQKVVGWAAGKQHEFSVKVVKDLKWQTAGAKHTLQMVVIKPLAYRLTKKSRLLYRNPTYLICTDNNMDIEELLQAYLWRWEIEVNFRDEKTILGAGKAQVRNPKSAENVPAFVAAAYSFMLLAYHKAQKIPGNKEVLPRAKWYRVKPGQRLTTGDIFNNLRAQLWAKALGCDSFTDFVKQQNQTRSRQNTTDTLSSAVCYQRK